MNNLPILHLKKIKMNKIILSATNTPLIEVFSWEQANNVIKAIWNAKKFSNVEYKLHFDFGVQQGTIDIEPRSHFMPYKETILTTHLKTFWSNLSNAKDIEVTERQYFAGLVHELPSNTPRIY